MRNLSLKAKLLLGFGVCIALGTLVAIVGLFGLNRVNQHLVDVNTKWMSSTMSLAEVMHDLSDARRSELDSLVATDAGTAAVAREAALEAARSVGKARKTYESLIASDDERRLYDAAAAAVDAYLADAQAVMRNSASGEHQAALSQSATTGLAEYTRAKEALLALKRLNHEGAQAEAAASAEAYANTRNLMLFATLLLLGIGVTVAVLIRGSIARVLTALEGSLAELARGAFPAPLDVRSGDEMQRIAEGTQVLVTTLRDFSTAQQAIHREHAAGQSSYRIDATRFQGAFGDMARSVNTIAEAHIAVTRRMADVVAAYARGDLSAEMDRLPGEQAAITAAVDGVRERLAGVRDEISRLADAAARGEFSARGDESRFEFAFREIVVTLNALMENAEGGLSLEATGYRLDEVVGRHHGMFLTDEYRASAEYRAFWAGLRAGRHARGEFLRRGKGGRTIWIEASYNPIMDPDGTPRRIVKLAADVTARRAHALDAQSQLAALDRMAAIAEFDLEGRILRVNPRFAELMGADEAELVGQHHRRFVAPDEAAGPGYAAFWAGLREGRPDGGQYRRFAGGGRPVWLEATYNPVLGVDGRPYKVVKFASDITARVRLSEALQEIVVRVRDATRHIAADARRINEGNAVLAGRSAESSQDIASTADAMTVVSVGVRRTVDAAQSASRDADEATAAARGGAAAVGGMESTMVAIRAASQRIADVVSVIDGVAFQTNLLALNAAVEAARAGEQGRGFAIVAGEVRQLASRCAASARDIRSLVGDSTRSVAEGAERVAAVGLAMHGILEAIDRVSGLMRAIARNAETQAAGVDAVGAAIGRLEAFAGDSGRHAREAAGLAESVDARAARLLADLEGFLGGAGMGPAGEAQIPRRRAAS